MTESERARVRMSAVYAVCFFLSVIAKQTFFATLHQTIANSPLQSGFYIFIYLTFYIVTTFTFVNLLLGYIILGEGERWPLKSLSITLLFLCIALNACAFAAIALYQYQTFPDLDVAVVVLAGLYSIVAACLGIVASRLLRSTAGFAAGFLGLVGCLYGAFAICILIVAPLSASLNIDALLWSPVLDLLFAVGSILLFYKTTAVT